MCFWLHVTWSYQGISNILPVCFFNSFLLLVWCTFLANGDQIDQAKEIIRKLQFTFKSDSFENPALQKHYANVEAMALDRDAPEDIEDFASKLFQSLKKTRSLLFWGEIRQIYTVLSFHNNGHLFVRPKLKSYWFRITWTHFWR